MEKETESGLALGAGVGFLLAQAIHFDIGLGLVMGALAGAVWTILLPEREPDGATPRQ